MARTDTLGNFLTDVAEAIRTKEGTTETIPASEFDTRIANLSSENTPYIFTQIEEPEIKNGVWIKTNVSNNKDVVVANEENIMFGESKWEANDEYARLPQGNGYACATSLNNKMYFGGGHYNNRLYEYSMETNKYTELPNIPFDFGWGGMCGLNDELYFFGGKHSPNTAYKYNVVNQTYTKLPNIPVGFVSAVSVTLNDKIYLITGKPSESSSTRYNTIYEFNPTLNEYKLFKSTIHSGDCKGAIGFKKYIYIFGGYGVNRICYQFDPINDVSKKMSTMPFDCVDTYACATEDAIYLVGSSESPYALWKYEPAIDKYTQLQNVPYSTWGPVSGALLYNKYLFAIGDTSSSHNRVQVYTIASKEYTNTPTDGLLIDQFDRSIATKFYDMPIESTFSQVRYYFNSERINDEIYYGDGTKWIKN